MVMIYTCIQEILSLNLNQDTGCPDWGSLWFFSVPSGKCQEYISGYDHFLPNPFQFFIHKSSYSCLWCIFIIMIFNTISLFLSLLLLMAFSNHFWLLINFNSWRNDLDSAITVILFVVNLVQRFQSNLISVELVYIFSFLMFNRSSKLLLSKCTN
jgi:hypothetical protein